MHVEEEVCLGLYVIYVGKFERSGDLKDLIVNGRLK